MLDNRGNGTVVDELLDNIKNGSNLSIISAYFTFYAYAELKKDGVNIFPMAIVNGTSQALRYDFSTQRLKPNISIFSPNHNRR